MAKVKESPADRGLSHFRCEQMTITNVNRKTWTVSVRTTHTSREYDDVPLMAPYAHWVGGEGFHHLPEVGATGYLGIPSDNTPPFIMGYIPPPGSSTSEDSDPARSTSSPEGSMTDVTYQANRPDANPGDIGFTTRDGSFVIAKRGGVLMLGSTGLAQRIYVPVGNYIRDFAQNYEMSTVAGDLRWLVEAPEADSTGKEACQWVFHTRQYAEDANASVRVRHTPLSAPGGGARAAWEVTVAANGIDTSTGSVSGATYTLLVTMDGEKTEVIGASRSITVSGDDSLSVEGDATWAIEGTCELSAKELKLGAQTASLAAKRVALGTEDATSPAVLGAEFVKFMSTAKWVVSGTTATLSPDSIAALTKILSTKVFVG